MPGKVRDALGKAADMRQRLTDIDRQINEHNQRLALITQEQGRIREDMKTVPSTTPYYARLLQKLNEQESSIEKLQQEREDLLAKRDTQRQELEAYLAALDIG